ncbi:hypothetical protein MSS4_04655 [Mycobacterium marinum]|nr:hypothetical protein MSS4_04655 [Mycobacterium marinum]
MIKVLCPKCGNPIARVDITEDGRCIPHGLPLDANPELKGPRHGLSFDFAATEDHSRFRITCRKQRCTYDGSCDYTTFCRVLVARFRAGHADYTPNF